MTGEQAILLLPHFVLLAAGNGIMILGAWSRNHRLLSALAGLSLGLAGALAVAVHGRGIQQFTPLLRLDEFALLFTALACAIGVGVVCYAHHYLAVRRETGEGFYVLLVFAVLGMSVLGASIHFASLFLGLEILTVCLYVLVGYLTKIGEVTFLDLTPAHGLEAGPLTIPAHGVCRLQHEGDTVTILPLDYDWFMTAVRAKTLTKLETALDGRQNLLLTSKTAVLRAWLLAHLKTADAFREPLTFTRIK